MSLQIRLLRSDLPLIFHRDKHSQLFSIGIILREFRIPDLTLNYLVARDKKLNRRLSGLIGLKRSYSVGKVQSDSRPSKLYHLNGRD